MVPTKTGGPMKNKKIVRFEIRPRKSDVERFYSKQGIADVGKLGKYNADHVSKALIKTKDYGFSITVDLMAGVCLFILNEIVEAADLDVIAIKDISIEEGQLFEDGNLWDSWLDSISDQAPKEPEPRSKGVLSAELQSMGEIKKVDGRKFLMPSPKQISVLGISVVAKTSRPEFFDFRKIKAPQRKDLNTHFCMVCGTEAIRPKDTCVHCNSGIGWLTTGGFTIPDTSQISTSLPDLCPKK